MEKPPGPAWASFSGGKLLEAHPELVSIKVAEDT